MPPILTVEGHVASPREFDRTGLLGLPGQVPDVGTWIEGRRGRAVWVRDLLESSGLLPGAATLTVRSGTAFSADVPLEAALETGLLIYDFHGGALPEAEGGPFRLFVPGAYDRCANVKAVDRIVINPGSSEPPP